MMSAGVFWRMRGSNGTPRKRGCIWKHSRLRRRWAGLLQRSCTNKEQMEQIFAISLTHNNDGYSGGGHKPQSAVRSEQSCRTWGRHNDNFWPCSTWWCDRALWVLETERWSDDTIKKSPFWMNKCRIYVTWPFLSLVQTTECQGTTSQQHGCKDPRLKPLELLRPDRRNTTLTMWLQRKVGFSYTSDEKRMVVFFPERKKQHTNLRHSCRSGSSEPKHAEGVHCCQPAHYQQSAIKNISFPRMFTRKLTHVLHCPAYGERPSSSFQPAGESEVGQTEVAWRETHTVGVHLHTTGRRTSFRLHCSSRSLHEIVFFLPWSLTSTFSI